MSIMENLMKQPYFRMKELSNRNKSEFTKEVSKME
jgi:hypothetical protein